VHFQIDDEKKAIEQLELKENSGKTKEKACNSK
jgi:hypothetical protein